MNSETLNKLIEQLLNFFDDHNIRAIAENEKIDFQVAIHSFVKDDDGLPSINNKFRFEIIIPNDYPKSKLVIRTKSRLFNPYFFYKMDYSEFNSKYLSQTNNLVEIVTVFIHILQFDSDYLGSNTSEVHNPDALRWYLKNKNTNMFPTDTFFAKRTKIFEIQGVSEPLKKKFELITNQTKITKKFEITDSKPAFKPQEQAEPALTIDENFTAIKDNRTDKNYKIYIREEAKKDIFNHINWSNKKTSNEQGGVLIGNSFFDKEKQITYSIVEMAIPADTAKGNQIHLTFDHNTWKKMIDLVDILLGSENERNLQVVGWYHTHPNALNIFMSPTDLETQKKFFYQDWHFAIVLNPQKEIWGAFHGNNAKGCLGFFIKNNIEKLPSPENETNAINNHSNNSISNETQENQHVTEITNNSEPEKKRIFFNQLSLNPKVLITVFFCIFILVSVFFIFGIVSDSTNGLNAFSKKDSITKQNQNKLIATIEYKKGLIIRHDSVIKSDSIGFVGKNEIVTILKNNATKKWYLIETRDSVKGWIPYKIDTIKTINFKK